MMICTKSTRLLLKRSLTVFNLSRSYSSQVQLNDAKHEKEAIRVRVALPSTGILLWCLGMRNFHHCFIAISICQFC